VCAVGVIYSAVVCVDGSVLDMHASQRATYDRCQSGFSQKRSRKWRAHIHQFVRPRKTDQPRPPMGSKTRRHKTS
jgi:hypothetical protein